MRNVRRKLGIFISLLVACTVFLVLESFFFPLWLDVRNWLLFIIDHPQKYAALVDRIHMLILMGGIVVSILASIISYHLCFLFIRARLITKKTLAWQEWFQQLYEEAPVPHLLIESNHKMQQPNKAALRFFGCTAEVLSLTTLDDMIAKEDHERLENLMRRFTHGLAVNQELIRITTKDHEIRWALVSIFPKEGQPFAARRQGLATFVDITEQKKLEDALRAQVNETQKFAQAVDSSEDSVAITTPDSAVVYVNAAWERLYGYTRKEIRIQRLACVWSDHTPPTVMENMRESIQAQRAFKSDEMIHRRKNGTEFHAEVETFPIFDAKTKAVPFYVHIGRDVSKRKEIDRAKSEFVSLTSHQLRTPLLTMQWYTEMLLSGDAGNLLDKQKEYVEKMHRGSKNIVSLVNLFLDVSKIEMGALPVKPQHIDPALLASEVLEELAPDIQKKSLHIEKDFPKAPGEITTDPHLLRVVFQNLFSNAVKYTPTDGSVYIALHTQKTQCTIEVRDSGCGIPAEEQSRVFTKLFRAGNASKLAVHGFGLGLYMTKSIVELLGGTITFSSTEGKGTTFEVTVPITYVPKPDSV